MRLDDAVEWEKISTERERPAMKPDTYRCEVFEVEDGAAETGTPRIRIKTRVIEGENLEREIWDNIFPKTKKGQTNKQGMGQIKEWAEATVGLERLSSPDFDTKEFEGHTVNITTDLEAYQVDDPASTTGGKKSKSKTIIKKVSRA